MALASPPVCDFGWPAPDFTLPATDGKTYELKDLAGSKGTLLMFICNHCPYVLAVIDRLLVDLNELKAGGIGIAAICSNDPVSYPADNFANMARMAHEWGLPFPYLHDPEQAVARAYSAVCTPDFFRFNAEMKLQYRGRLDNGAGLSTPGPGRQRELVRAMQMVADTGEGPPEQTPSMGCSIKWTTG